MAGYSNNRNKRPGYNAAKKGSGQVGFQRVTTGKNAPTTSKKKNLIPVAPEEVITEKAMIERIQKSYKAFLDLVTSKYGNKYRSQLKNIT